MLDYGVNVSWQNDMAVQIQAMWRNLLAHAKVAPQSAELWKHCLHQNLCHHTHAAFVLRTKPTQGLPRFCTWFISSDAAWHAFGRNVFFNKNKPLTSDDMDSWVLLWLDTHCLRQQAGFLGPQLLSPTFMS